MCSQQALDSCLCVDVSELKFHCPFTCQISGSTGSGKSWFVSNFLRNLSDVVDCDIDRIIYIHGEHQPLYDELQRDIENIEFIHLKDDTLAEHIPLSGPALIVLDDLYCELRKSKTLIKLFSKYSHHRNLSVIFIQQVLFVKEPNIKELSQNSHYLILFRNLRDKSNIKFLARQIEPTKCDFFVDSYIDATKKKFGYFVCDQHPQSLDPLRYRTDIIPLEKSIIYTDE